MKTQTLNKKKFIMGGVIVLIAALLLAAVIPWITNASAEENGSSVNPMNPTPTITSVTPEKLFDIGPVNLTIKGSYDNDDCEDFVLRIYDEKGQALQKLGTWVIPAVIPAPNYIITSTGTEFPAVGKYYIQVGFEYSQMNGEIVWTPAYEFIVGDPTPTSTIIATVDLNGGTLNPEAVKPLTDDGWSDNGDGTWSKPYTTATSYKNVLRKWDGSQVSISKNGQIKTGWSPAADDTMMTQNTTFKALYGDEGQGDLIDDEGSSSNLAQTGDGMAFALIALSLVVASSVVVLTRRHNKANH
ncbi:MAG: hypothetical protein Q4E88_01450 [Coriobacteriia bacterium]|nr:hypothetical protein [Coriobacteriia bacterium]